MKRISLFTVIIYIFSFAFVRAAEGHSHDVPKFLHFMEELIEEHSILKNGLCSNQYKNQLEELKYE